MLKGDFTQNMGRVFVIYLIGCLICASGLTLLSLAGVADRIIGGAFILLTVIFYASMGSLGKSARDHDDPLAGQHVPALYNGMASAADWMSAASFIGLAGAIYAAGYDGLAFLVGWSGGYILVAVLLAPYLRKFGRFTVPDFLSARYGGAPARMAGILILLSVSFVYLVAQLLGTGIIAARFLGLDFHLAVFVGLAGILFCSLRGGMRSLIWTQVAQYAVVAAAYLLPVTLLSIRATGNPLPQFSYGLAMERISRLAADLGLATGGAIDGLNFFGIAVCLMLGTASLPHVLSRYFATPSVREARTSVAWSLLFISILYSAAPAYAAFVKLEILQSAAGPGGGIAPSWLTDWSRIGLASVDATAGAGRILIDPDAVVLAAPEIAGLPFFIAALAAAGALAATLSSADGLLLSIGRTASHDLHRGLLAPDAPPERARAIGRTAMILAALLAAWAASARPAGIVTIVGWAFSLAASGLFPALVLGIWWKRATGRGAVAGMAAGWIVCLFYIVAGEVGWIPLACGIKTVAAGLFGVPVSFVATWAASLASPPPGPEMQAFIDSIRTPRGRVRPLE